ncbi:hypothetical protein JCM5353_005883 [Sporobolomyces roseus]
MDITATNVAALSQLEALHLWSSSDLQLVVRFWTRSLQGTLVSREMQKSVGVDGVSVWSERWYEAHMLDFGLGGIGPVSSMLLGTLKEVLDENARLAMDIKICQEGDTGAARHFTETQFQDFLSLLSATNIQQLELRMLKRIPSILGSTRLQSLQLLRLSGSFSLKGTDAFDAFLSLLLALPDLIQLHLVGSLAFGNDSNADAISKLGGFRLQSLSSSSSNKSIEMSSGDMGTAENATGGGHASSIPQLPDEILLRIFEIIRDDIVEDSDFSGIAVGANSYLRVNRHCFYSLLRSSWFSTLFDHSEASARIAEVLKQPLILTWIRELSVTLFSDSPPYAEFANFSGLVNLHKLTVRFQDRDYRHRTEQTINVELMLRPLVKLSKLVDLDFSSTFKSSLASLSLVKVAPILQYLRLSVRECDSLYNVLGTCPKTLQRLELATVETPLQHYECARIPWGTVKKVSLFSVRDTMCKRGLFDGLEQALYPVAPHTEIYKAKQIPLESLELTFDISSKSDEHFDLRDLHDLLELLVPASIKSLKLTLVAGDDCKWGVAIAVPSLEKLTLYGCHSLRNEDSFTILWRIICSFPSLRILHLRGFELSETPPSIDALMPLDEGELGLPYPELCALLLYLEKKTQVVEVIYRDLDAEEWMNWHRLRPGDSFQKDSYHSA